jgi:alpha-soluble NSF attachment protein
MTGGGGFLSKIGFGKSKEEKLEDAWDLYEKAANNYKLGDDFLNAGHCYEKCAEIERLTDGVASNYMQESLSCYKKADPGKYAMMVDSAVQSLCWEGKISQAARMKKEQGEHLEELYETELAARAFIDAGKLFEKEDLS